MRRLFMAALSAVTLQGAENLKSLIEAAQSNELASAYEAQVHAASQSYDAAYRQILPRFELGGSSSWLDEKGSFDAGNINSAHATMKVALFDGFSRSNRLDERQSLLDAGQSDLEGLKKQLALQVATTYFSLQSTTGDIGVLEKKKTLLETELAKQEKFYAARIGTLEELERIRAEAAANDYRLEELRYRRDELASELEVLTGKTTESVEESSIEAPNERLENREPDALRSLRKQGEALHYQAEQVADGNAYPVIALEDTYTWYDYNDDNAEGFIERVEKQNRLMVTLNYNLYDFGVTSAQEEALRAKKLAVDHETAYRKKEADAALKLSKRAIKRAQTLLHSAELSLRASTRSFEAVEKKYHAGVSDYVTYLDALAQQSEAQSNFNSARASLQIAYARYYYNAGYDLKEFVK